MRSSPGIAARAAGTAAARARRAQVVAHARVAWEGSGRTSGELFETRLRRSDPSPQPAPARESWVTARRRAWVIPYFWSSFFWFSSFFGGSAFFFWIVVPNTRG